MKLFNHRKFYDKDSLSIDEIGDNPMNFFKKWFRDAEKSDKIIEESSNVKMIELSETSTSSDKPLFPKTPSKGAIIFSVQTMGQFAAQPE